MKEKTKETSRNKQKQAETEKQRKFINMETQIPCNPLYTNLSKKIPNEGGKLFYLQLELLCLHLSFLCLQFMKVLCR